MLEAVGHLVSTDADVVITDTPGKAIRHAPRMPLADLGAC